MILWDQSGTVRDINNNIIVDVDQNGGLIPIAQNTTVLLEDGIQVTFSLDPAVTTNPQFHARRLLDLHRARGRRLDRYPDQGAAARHSPPLLPARRGVVSRHAHRLPHVLAAGFRRRLRMRRLRQRRRPQQRQVHDPERDRPGQGQRRQGLPRPRASISSRTRSRSPARWRCRSSATGRPCWWRRRVPATACSRRSWSTAPPT